ncbi:tRNA preQ1(34) S-adenosylmethionine ribosyltransferase-isomerase QueA [Candidatus Falkowbacteria bacterium CG10_big_fil_rev_8_21_14_0_10_37_14]|uniref:S-adenosylmethionine:tRNA ribosyltransferase-isomerase n=1 Tax=Candidatus Falkowbacteria bacterium CG10_big_fil_rev_8_21_14_0_10_37_14 TaxID=1974561 RepID=A0A2M6WTF5_9BACT|nr:tRNA preQ1(34) S-adenosylmethionine ribosyltransferase-isomerase QueA [Candidatus Falkowbacteria bacterium]PIT96062.1 MAG: tRNA preQ1(34) S-adenosylmethionine ribosyltransferase-isomerase QueA [Candidatus Falkowbacteria bacterium CG10_big_fil_rev_8_21_14_0_10_37_14]
MWKLTDFDYNLSDNLIATAPVEPRDRARLLILDKADGNIVHRHFNNILDYLSPGDCLVLNNSKVLPARLSGIKESGGVVEVFLSKRLGEVWECLLKGRVKVGLVLKLSEKLTATLETAKDDGTWLVRFNLIGSEFFKAVEMIGQVPLPPYIIKQRGDDKLSASDKTDYQTVYADAEKQGSVAAPTAGLHFTPELLEMIKCKGVEIVFITLHVGLGTFLPVKVDNIEEHQIHSEWAEVSQETVEKIVQAKQSGKKIIAVGTTTTRTLEYFANKILRDVAGLADWVDIFIYPPYQFKIVDSVITNFHLPKSTLLMLVSALAGKNKIDEAYKQAISQNYRFYSYGDAMLIK